jgi:DNA invertase Pin-like site-specific DNA recombinase/5-bromo-4-chloroindolyl phosphate hydrolysis protein
MEGKFTMVTEKSNEQKCLFDKSAGYLNHMKEDLQIAVGYVRCSTDMQDDSVEQQKNEIIKWATKNHLTLRRFYEDEGKSGTTFTKRPAFQVLLNTVENKPDFSYVLVYDESRWGRAADPRENSYWKQHFKRHGITVRIIHTNSTTGNGMADYMLEVVESAEASEYSKKLSRSTLRGMKDNAKKGYSCGGTAPYGYKRIGLNKVTGVKTRDLHPGERAHVEEKVLLDLGSAEEVTIVNKIFELRLHGMGYRAIANILNKEEIPCPRRGRWKNRDQKWSVGTILSIATNPTYVGVRVFNRHPQSHLSGPGKKAWFSDPDEWILKENAHPAIISKETFDIINKRRKAYTRTNRFFYESPYLLSGLIKCSNCNFNFQGQTKTVKPKTENGQPYKAGYYIDGGYANKGNSVCVPFLIRQDEIENFLINNIGRLIEKSTYLDDVKKAIKEKLQSDSNTGVQIDELNSKKLENHRQIQNLVTLVKKGINIDEVEIEIQKLNRERKFIEDSISEAKSKSTNEDGIEIMVEQVHKLINNFIHTFKKSPLYLQKSFIRRFINKIIVDPHSKSITCYVRKVPTVQNPMSVIDLIEENILVKMNVNDTKNKGPTKII